MGQLKFINRKKLIEFLDEELRLHLNEQGLYELSQYGWLNDGELDPQYCGHAMWQVKPPALKKLLILGEEFTNLMRSARHSLGLTSLYSAVSDSQLNDCGYSCSYYYTDTITKLNLSSDRIREFLIAAFARRPSSKTVPPAPANSPRGKKVYDTFKAPFQQILDEVSLLGDRPSSLRENLTATLPLAEKIAIKRSQNQNPVHHLIRFQNQIIATANNLSMGYPDEALAHDPTTDSVSSTEELTDWYRTLVELSNLVFMAEHLQRRQNRQTGLASGRQQNKHKIIG